MSLIDFPSDFTCLTCNGSLVHRYQCVCDNDWGQCEQRPTCRFYYCTSCRTEEKVDQNQIDKENERRGKDLRTETGEIPFPDEQRHWSEKEKDVLTSMLKKIASPDAKWRSADEMERQSAGTESLWTHATKLTAMPLAGDGMS